MVNFIIALNLSGHKQKQEMAGRYVNHLSLKDDWQKRP